MTASIDRRAVDRFERLDRQTIRAEFFCPFPGEENPRSTEAAELVHSWMRQFSFASDGPELRYLWESNALQLAGWLYPTAGFDALVLGTKFLAVGCMLDIIGDNLVSRGAGDLVPGLLADCTAALDGDRISRPGEAFVQQPIALALRDFSREIALHARAGWLRRFRGNIMSFLISSGRELENRASGKISNLGNFIDERMETGFTRPLVDLVEIVVGVYLPPFVQRSPEMTALVEATVEHVTWVNDIQSWNKEQLASDPHNIVTVLRHHEGCSLAEAVDRTTERLAKNIHTFLEMEERLSVRFPDFVGDLRRFTGGVRRLLIGHCLWYGHTERYRVASPVEPCGTLSSFVEPVLVTTYARSA